jgi:hypothetical protein
VESESRREPPGFRVPIFDDPEQGVDVIGLALVFPRSKSAATREYIQGLASSQE